MCRAPNSRARSARGRRRDTPGKDVLDLISRAGTDLVPAADSPAGRKLHLKAKVGRAFCLPPNTTTTLADLRKAPSILRALEFTVPREQAIEFGRARLRVVWDGSPHASIDAPVALFFGAGTLYNRDNREYLVKAFPVNVRFDEERCISPATSPCPFSIRHASRS